MSCKELFFKPSNRQHSSPECDLTGHRDVCPNRNFGQCRNKRCTHANTGTWAVFWRSTLGYVHVKIVFFVEIVGDTQTRRTASNYGKRGLDRLLHHITKRACLNHSALPRRKCTLYGQQFTSHLSPSKPRYLPNLLGFLRQPVIELAHSGIVLEHVGLDSDHSFLVDLHMLAHHFAAYLGNFPFQTTHTGFASVITHNIAQRGFA